jgi:ATP-dependent Zn protease
MLMMLLCACRVRLTNNTEVASTIEDEDGWLLESYQMRRDQLGAPVAERPIFKGFDSGNDEVFIGRTMSHGRSYSEAVAAQIDEEVKGIISTAYDRCETLLTERRAHLDAVAEYLLENETMDRDAFLRVLGEKTAEKSE